MHTMTNSRSIKVSRAERFYSVRVNGKRRRRARLLGYLSCAIYNHAHAQASL